MWRSIVNRAKNLQRPLKAGNFFSTGMTINCSRRTLLYGVREHTLRMMRMYALRTYSSATTGRAASASTMVVLVVVVVVLMALVLVVVLLMVVVLVLVVVRDVCGWWWWWWW